MIILSSLVSLYYQKSDRLFFLIQYNVVKEKLMKQYRFIIVGSGWRSLYYVRIAKALSSKLKLEAMLCRSNEKAEMISNTYHIPTSTSIEECISLKPDFVVVAVDKSHIAEVSMEWLEKGFPVLCETPAALDLETLNKLWKMHT